MKNEILQKAKGTRDFGPEEKMNRDAVLDKIVRVFKLFGYDPIETPVLERYELFAFKAGLGESSDALKETFKLQDQGMRDLVLRTEFTVPLARFVASNPNLQMPFKRYQLGPVFRDGPIKLGRYREFYQCDVDIVGTEKMTADAEIIQIIQTVFAELDMDVEIVVNSRKIINDVLKKVGVAEDKWENVIISLDKVDKIGTDGVVEEMTKERDISEEQARELIVILSLSKDFTNEQALQALKDKLGESDGLKEIAQVLDLVDDQNVRFLPSLARGLAYYTGTVFEVFLKGREISSSLAGGGRYDNMIGAYSESKEQIPAVGVAFGPDVIFDALKKLNSSTSLGTGSKCVQKQTSADVYVAVIGDVYKKGMQVAQDLRKQGVNVLMDLQQQKLKKNLEIASKQGITWMIIIGEDEVAKGEAVLRNLEKGKQENVKIGELVDKLK